MVENGFTVRENDLLNMLAAGELDGIYDIRIHMKEEISSFVAIAAGRPSIVLEKPVKRTIENGKLVRHLGETITIEIWKTEGQKLTFLRTYGEFIDNPLVQEYVELHRKEKQKIILIQPMTVEALRKVYNFDTGCYPS